MLSSGSALPCAVAVFLWATGSARGAEPAPAPEARKLFLKNCAPCHGPDGKARSPAARKLGVRDLTLSRLKDAEIRRQITEGIRDPSGNAKMPAFKDGFTPAELEALVAWVKKFRR